jgi:hypothetical protein
MIQSATTVQLILSRSRSSGPANDQLKAMPPLIAMDWPVM